MKYRRRALERGRVRDGKNNARTSVVGPLVITGINALSQNISLAGFWRYGAAGGEGDAFPGVARAVSGSRVGGGGQAWFHIQLKLELRLGLIGIVANKGRPLTPSLALPFPATITAGTLPESGQTMVLSEVLRKDERSSRRGKVMDGETR